VSALDLSTQSQIINLLADLQQSTGMSYLFIAHDLGVTRHISDRIAVLLGGRVAEEIIFDEISTGAGNDLERVSDLARRMVMEYGMSRTLGALNYRGAPRSAFVPSADGAGDGHVYSEETAREIDQEVRGIVDGTYERVRGILSADRAILEVLAQRLLEQEVVDEAELREIMGLPPRTKEPEPSRVVVTPPAGSGEDGEIISQGEK
jgi:cell division protease FtsH